jgi:hypothetical protein
VERPDVSRRATGSPRARQPLRRLTRLRASGRRGRSAASSNTAPPRRRLLCPNGNRLIANGCPVSRVACDCTGGGCAPPPKRPPCGRTGPRGGRCGGRQVITPKGHRPTVCQERGTPSAPQASERPWQPRPAPGKVSEPGSHGFLNCAARSLTSPVPAPFSERMVCMQERSETSDVLPPSQFLRSGETHTTGRDG